jgi:hypothetical protein
MAVASCTNRPKGQCQDFWQRQRRYCARRGCRRVKITEPWSDAAGCVHIEAILWASLCGLYRGRILAPSSRFWTRFAPAPFAWLSPRALTLQQFKFHKAISASAIGFVDRVDARSMPFKMDFLHRNSRICHRVFLLKAVLSRQSRPVNRKEAFRPAHPATGFLKIGASRRERCHSRELTFAI